MAQTHMVVSEDVMVSISALARTLDCSPKTIRDWLYKARKAATLDPLPYYRLNGLIRFRKREVMAWVERRRIRTSAAHDAAL